MALRLFIAVDLDDQVRRRIQDTLEALKALAPNARWMKPDAWHLTLAFLGNVDEPRVPGLCQSLAGAVRPHAAFELQVRTGGGFGAPSHPRVLWIGTRSDALMALQSDLEHALGTAGFPLEERAFRPHITLARAKFPRGERELAACANRLSLFDGGACRIGEIVLYESQLTSAGARHQPIFRAPLRAGA